jgi:phenylacetate-CoA ligase
MGTHANGTEIPAVSLYEPLFRNILFPAYEGGLRRRGTVGYLREYERNQWLSSERISELQWSKLLRLVRHCWDEVPYYRDSWTKLGIGDPRDVVTPEDYARLPVLTKRDIRENFDRLIAPSYREQLLFKTTGGSTGEPLRFGYTRESYERRIAVMFRGYEWAGARMGQRTLYLWGASLAQPMLPKWKDRLYHGAFNRCFLNAFAMSDARMDEYVRAFNTFRPEVVVSYVAPLMKLIQWARENGRSLHVPQCVLTAAEALHEPQRKVIEEALGCPAYNTYGCREFMLVAAECSHREGLHVNADHLRVELGPAEGSGPQDVIVTDLHNYGMPLLRYANGDLARPGQGACSCGRGLPLLASVEGRRLDALRSADGHFVPGEFIVYIFLNAKGIERYQVTQRSVDRFDVALVPGRDFDESVLEMLRRELAKAVGDSVQMDFHLVEDIPLTPTGKLRVTVSELA